MTTWKHPRVHALLDAVILATVTSEALAHDLHAIMRDPPSDSRGWTRYLPPIPLLERIAGRSASATERELRADLDLKHVIPGEGDAPDVFIPNLLPWMGRADRYSEGWVAAREATDAATRAVTAAAADIDGDESKPLDRQSHQLLEALNWVQNRANLRITYGWNPHSFPAGAPAGLFKAIRQLTPWIEKLRPMAEVTVDHRSPAIMKPADSVEDKVSFPFRDDHITILMELASRDCLTKASVLDGRSGMPQYERLVRLFGELERGGYVERLPGKPRSGFRISPLGKAELARRAAESQ